MQYQKSEHNYVIVCEQGEEVIKTLTKFCTDNNIANAHLTGIGAVSSLSCGYYNLEEKKYYFTTYNQMLEVVGLTGNVMLKDDKPFVHVHGIFTDQNNAAFGGHIEHMTVGVTLEIILTPLASTLERTRNDTIGLALINYPADHA